MTAPEGERIPQTHRHCGISQREISATSAARRSGLNVPAVVPVCAGINPRLRGGKPGQGGLAGMNAEFADETALRPPIGGVCGYFHSAIAE